jgi:hypothetical protein
MLSGSVPRIFLDNLARAIAIADAIDRCRQTRGLGATRLGPPRVVDFRANFEIAFTFAPISARPVLGVSAGFYERLRLFNVIDPGIHACLEPRGTSRFVHSQGSFMLWKSPSHPGHACGMPEWFLWVHGNVIPSPASGYRIATLKMQGNSTRCNAAPPWPLWLLHVSYRTSVSRKSVGHRRETKKSPVSIATWHRTCSTTI